LTNPRILIVRIDTKMRARKGILFVFLMVALAQIGFGQASEHFPLPINPDLAKSVQVYPNPATDFINIKLELPIAKRLKLDLHNIIGSTLETELEIIDDFEIRIKTKDLPVGYYMIALREGDSSVKATFKFLKR
jgi:hypothetical protein